MKKDIYNINYTKNESFTNNLTTIIYSLIPVFLIIGTAVSEFAIILLTLRYLVEIFILRKIKLFKNNFLYFLLIIYLALLINLIFSININNSILRDLFFIKYIIFTIGTVHFLSEKKDRLFLIFKIWALTIIIFSFDLYIQFFTHKNLIGLSSPLQYHRLSGFMGDELKAGSLLLSISFTSACFLIVHTKLKNTALLLLFIFLIAIFITGDRSNFIKSNIVILFLLLVIDKKYLKKNLILLLLSITIISFTISNSPVFKNRYFDKIYLELKDNSYNIRNYIKNNEYGKIYNSAYTLFLEKKIFGLGNKNYRIICEENFQHKYDLNIKDVESLKCNTHPHQIYFEILSEHGLFGLMIMLSMLFTFIYHNLYYVYKSKNIFLTSMFILIIVTFVPLLPGGSFFTSFNATLFWINFSFYYAYKNICNQIK